MHGDAARVAADQLVKVKVHVAVAHAAPVACPPHLRARHNMRSGQYVAVRIGLQNDHWVIECGTLSSLLLSIAQTEQCSKENSDCDAMQIKFWEPIINDAVALVCKCWQR